MMDLVNPAGPLTPPLRKEKRGETELHLHLPPGYHVHLDPDVLVLGRTDGSVVGRFSGRGLVAEEAERVAWEDYGAASPDREREARAKQEGSAEHGRADALLLVR
jgi:hypothetical protein